MSGLTSAAMTRSLPWVDRFAIGVSLLCLAHCLLTPVLLVVLPSISASLLLSENLHLNLVYVVIPSSLFALGMGCKRHRRRSFMVFGLCGLSFLILGVCIELIGLKHLWEQIFTILGALIIALAHLRNFQMCHKSKDSLCH
jgi:hypothetical protein